MDDFTIIDILLMDQIVKEINIQHSGHQLKVDSFHHRGRPWAVFTIRDRREADFISREIRHRYEEQMKVIEAKIDTYKEALAMVLKEPHTIIKKIEMGDKYIKTGTAVLFIYFIS